jgi:hypothetical protein
MLRVRTAMRASSSCYASTARRVSRRILTPEIDERRNARERERDEQDEPEESR